MITMKSPYKIALLIPFLFVFDCFLKNETVKGIIGKTQGVKSANNQPKKPNNKIFNKLEFSSEFELFQLFKSSVFFKSN